MGRRPRICTWVSNQSPGLRIELCKNPMLGDVAFDLLQILSNEMPLGRTPNDQTVN